MTTIKQIQSNYKSTPMHNPRRCDICEEILDMSIATLGKIGKGRIGMRCGQCSGKRPS